MTCEHCGGWVKHRRISEFHPDAVLGLPGVLLVNGVTANVCAECHDADVTIPNLAGAIAAAGIARVKHPVKLTGAELGALRRAAGYTAKALAEVLDVSAETISRWETGAEPIGDYEGLARRALGNALDPAFDTTVVLYRGFDARRSDGRPPEIRLELASGGAWTEATRAA